MRSLTLDTVKDEWTETLRRVGNRRSNAVYEAHLPEDFNRGRVLSFIIIHVCVCVCACARARVRVRVCVCVCVRVCTVHVAKVASLRCSEEE